MEATWLGRSEVPRALAADVVRGDRRPVWTREPLRAPAAGPRAAVRRSSSTASVRPLILSAKYDDLDLDLDLLLWLRSTITVARSR